MKRDNLFITFLVIIFLSFIVTQSVLSQDIERTGFTSPQKGDTIEYRKDFEVSLEIDNFDKTTGHHWLALATVTGHDSTWDRVLELYQKVRNKYDEKAISEMRELISKWKLEQVWPKFYIPKSPYEGRVFDGGQNPLKGLEPQPMILLILKVDDTFQGQFRTWFRDGAAGKGFPGFKAEKFPPNMILARCEIFFP